MDIDRRVMQQLCSDIQSDNEILLKARSQAGSLVNNNPRKMTNCCGATLSYLLIDGTGLDLKPAPRAMKLAYILEKELGFKRIQLNEDKQIGDVGVVDQPIRRIQSTFETDDIEDGDALEQSSMNAEAKHRYAGEGYVEPDPSNLNTHHIYLILGTHPVPNKPTLVLIADNQSSTPHLRDVNGGNRSKTNYFLRAPE